MRLGAIVLLFLAILQPAHAADRWSFETHPHPSYPDEYAQEDLAMIADINALGFDGCAAQVAFDYLIYNRTYPDYALKHDGEDGLEAWKLHVLRTERSASAFCIVQTVSEALREVYILRPSESRLDGLFCGRFGRPAETILEDRVVELLHKLVSFAETGHYFAIPELLRSRNWLDFRFNPDIRYYLEARQERRYGNEPAPILRQAVIELQGRDRLAFVEDAIARNDLAGVIATSPDCSAFTPEARAKAREAARGDPI
ncbi:hypothetical protein [Martelella soudanensis]|uniref:hypothetical protein n=1 Tax=unclassified Martelella TaxID=2629616 RepID=UPI0015DE7455|nr:MULTISPECIES: hypothetical protein [unclassified Martelella]